jgi:hypothetical protein
MQRRGVDRVTAQSLANVPVGFRVARQNASFTNLGHLDCRIGMKNLAGAAAAA